jgi:TRAP-type C4-dicarboxylate transport system permease small subunit
MMRVLEKIEQAVGAVLFTLMFGAVVVQVFFRYALSRPLVWPFEFSVYCYIGLIYVGSAMASGRGTHVAFDMIHARMSEPVRLCSSTLTGAALASLMIYLIPPSIEYIRFTGDIRSSALGIPWGWVLATFPAGMALMALHTGARAASDAAALVRYIRGRQS